MTKAEAIVKAKALAASTHLQAAIWFAGNLTGWEYGIVSPNLCWVEYV